MIEGWEERADQIWEDYQEELRTANQVRREGTRLVAGDPDRLDSVQAEYRRAKRLADERFSARMKALRDELPGPRR